MADAENTRQRIIASVFSRRNASGTLEETYAGHLKIWENDASGQKPRYILLSQAKNGSGFIHKSKLNSNSTFSVGKTWNVSELRGLEVLNPTHFNITLARTYQWHAEDATDQDSFLNSLVRLFRNVVGSNVSLQLVGFSVPLVPQSSRQTARGEQSRQIIPPPPLPLIGPAPTTRPRPQTNQQSQISANVRNGTSSSRPSSPFTPSQTRSPVPPSARPRPSSPSALAPRAARAASPAGTRTRPISPNGMGRPRPASPFSAQRRPRPGSPVMSPPDRPRPTSPNNSPGWVRPSSPTSSRSRTSPSRSRPASPPRQRPGSPMSQSSTVRPRPGRRPSATTMSTHSSTSTTGIPSIVAPPLSPVPARPAVNTSSFRMFSQTQGPPARPSLDVPSPQGISSAPSSALSVSPTSAYGATPLPQSSRRGRYRERDSSPAPSNASYSPNKSRTSSPGPTPLDSAPSQASRRDPNARISYFDPTNQAVIDRLLSGDIGEDDGEEGEDGAEASMASIEEMIEGYEWASGDMMGRKRTHAADQIEARLLDELMAVDKANIHSFLESDDRITTVLKYLDEAILELDNMDSLVSSYKIHLNAVSDDISFIQSQNRGLQVQTQNQKALLSAMEQLLQTVHVDRETLLTLTQESLEKVKSIQKLEEAAAELYKALLAGRDNDMAATMERLDEYRTHNAQFCKRILDFLTIMFTAQSDTLLGTNRGVLGLEDKGQGRPTIINHQELETYLGRYSGLMLYLKEMDESRYSKVCAAYFSAASHLHTAQMKALLAAYTSLLKKSPEEEGEQTFGVTPTSASYRAAGGLRRAGTVVRSPLDSRKDKDKQPSGDLRTSEALGFLLDQMAPQVYREEQFMADFLQINDAAFTFADYMGLEHYFRRQASRSSGLTPATFKLVRGAMDLIFGSIPAELKTWIDAALSKDSIQIAGVIACIERAIVDAEERGNPFFVKLLEKQHLRLKGMFDRHVDEQIKAVEHTKLTSKKRKGVAHFIKYFPVYMNRVESQIVGSEDLEIRGCVDAAYERVVQSMFDSLKQMAKLDGEGEDKGQLNYHVILIENMHYFVAEVSQQEIPAVNIFRQRAETIYDENLTAYVKIVLRRSFAKIIDYFEGVERLLKTTAPTEVSKNSAYNRSALKRVLKEYSVKDVRKNIDGLFKRVEKHFTEASENTTTEGSSGIAPGTVLVGVWKACEEELLRVTDLFLKRMNQCYADTGVSLEYSPADVEASFKRHRIGS